MFSMPFFSSSEASTPKRHHVLTVLKMKKSLEEEINKRKLLEKQLNRMQTRSKGAINTADSVRASELEIENEKLRKDFQLMRNSLNRGVENQELQGKAVSPIWNGSCMWRSILCLSFLFSIETSIQNDEDYADEEGIIMLKVGAPIENSDDILRSLSIQFLSFFFS